MLEQHITQLTEDIQLPSPGSKDPDGYFHLTFSDDLIISLKDLSPGFCITGRIAPIPTARKEETLIYVMKANFLEQGTGEQVIGIDSEEKFLTLSRTIAYEVNYIKFKEIVEDFVNYLSSWKDELKKMQTIKQAP